jgi:hypothetical protein
MSRAVLAVAVAGRVLLGALAGLVDVMIQDYDTSADLSDVEASSALAGWWGESCAVAEASPPEPSGAPALRNDQGADHSALGE